MIIKNGCIIYSHGSRKVPIYYGENKIKDLFSYLDKLRFDKIAIITDENVEKHLGRKLNKILSSYEHKFFIFPDGEKSKEFPNYKNAVNILFDWKVSRDSLIIAFGGGAVGNLAGFVASTIYRGIKFVHIPTTIISQADSTIGGKQSINTYYGKNTLGSIYEPEFILTDFNFLKTLPEKEIRSGLAESIKHGLCQDEIFLEKFSKKSKRKKFINEVVEETIKLKINLFELDKEGANESKVFVYGHEIGHAIEALSKGRLAHGESVSIGMCCSANISNNLGHLPARSLKKHYSILKEWNLPTKIPRNISPKEIIGNLESSGKLNKNKLEIVLLNNIGFPLKTRGIVGTRVGKENLFRYIKDCY